MPKYLIIEVSAEVGPIQPRIDEAVENGYFLMGPVQMCVAGSVVRSIATMELVDKPTKKSAPKKKKQAPAAPKDKPTPKQEAPKEDTKQEAPKQEAPVEIGENLAMVTK